MHHETGTKERNRAAQYPDQHIHQILFSRPLDPPWVGPSVHDGCALGWCVEEDSFSFFFLQCNRRLSYLRLSRHHTTPVVASSHLISRTTSRLLLTTSHHGTSLNSAHPARPRLLALPHSAIVGSDRVTSGLLLLFVRRLNRSERKERSAAK